MEIFDGITLVVITPILLLASFVIGAIVRGILTKGNYKISFGSIVGNIIIGLIAVVIIHSATK